ncbi:tetratricopeptide repeat protein [Aurantiacibacter poecillastricola]|uniref:tetratricopeptide repeat protein n=1 Tax=Aurantiacibacter poecillastricola TaxID=3064385 RepID=UPI00273F8BC1|nr:tetratricopeptide repeat protein [Aurantiacibacter sp. 219JJ12-13]MDP5261810.1 putative 2OG-Fe(II) oxygenase [Aurantiacibacter sp. 219JJ12-13]
MNRSPDEVQAEARARAAGGDLAGALEIMDTGLAAHPASAPLANSAGNLAMKLGDPGRAADYFGAAAKLEPQSLEFAVNHAIALGAAERHEEALSALLEVEDQGCTNPRYCSVRGNAARGARQLDEAAIWYERSVTLAPGGAKATHGRARVALERGEPDAVERFERALSLNQADAEAWLGYAEALDAGGRAEQARDLAEKLVAQAPQWLAALRLLAQLRLAAGEHDFTSHFATAQQQRPDDPAIARAHVQTLELHDRFAEAMALAEQASARFPGDGVFPLLQASYAGIVGDDALATRLFAELSLDTPERCLLEARYILHAGEYERAAVLLDRVIESDPWHINAWAVRDILWRQTNDPRGEWLHGQEGLVRMIPLPDGDAVLHDAVPVLHRLHDQSAFPLGQSLRGGTQTRGSLFDRVEPELRRLHEALLSALEDYRSALPPHDPTHPLLRHRDGEMCVTGSWSVRLSGGGDFHAAHLHPDGIVSSALYCDLPDSFGKTENREGFIELGRPPPKMRLDLEPRYTLRPRQGHLALFPSTLYHGTRPFAEGTRMTVAFDVQCREQE